MPPGSWHEPVSDNANGGQPEVSRVLMRVNGREVDAAVLVRVNRLGQSVRWGLPPACLSTEFTPRRVFYASDHDGACAYAAFADGTGPLSGVPIDPVWRAAMQAAVDRGWNVPATWYGVTFRLTDPVDAMQVRYLFHPWPVSDRRPPDSAAWRRIQADRLAAWIAAVEPRISQGFRGRLRTHSEASLPDPERTTEAARPDPAIASSEPAAAETMRGVSGRLVAAVADFGVLWAFIGNPVTASAIAGAKFAAQSVTGVTHEAAWSWLSPPQAPSDLPGVGVESPLPR